jgi:PhnB protein
MASTVKPIPKGHHSVTPYLIIKGAAKAIEFYKRAFGAKEVMRIEHDNAIGHAEIKIGDSLIMLADEYPDRNIRGPQTLGGSSVSIMLYVEEVDNFVQRAVDAGAKVERPVEDQFFGDRLGSIKDPFGHVWHIATHIEDVPAKELQKRANAAYAQQG